MMRGFSLIEILIALLIFAILSTITAFSLFHAFDIKDRLTRQNNELNQLQLVINLMQRDISQGVTRAVRASEGRLIAPFKGSNDYFELTRGGVVNPNFKEISSTLYRIAYFCRNQALWRRSWHSLDSLDRRQFYEEQLLSSLERCNFHYLDAHLQTFSKWQEYALNRNQSKASLPKAIKLDITLKMDRRLELWFAFSQGLYGE